MFCCLFLYLLKTNNLSSEQPASNETGREAGGIKKTKQDRKTPGSFEIAVFLAIYTKVQVQYTPLYMQNI